MTFILIMYKSLRNNNNIDINKHKKQHVKSILILKLKYYNFDLERFRLFIYFNLRKTKQKKINRIMLLMKIYIFVP